MKLKHRKLILIISMSAMGVGLITFSIAGSKEKQANETVSVAKNSVIATEEPTVSVTAEPTEVSTETPAPTEEVTETPTVTPTEEPTEEPTDTPTTAPTEAPITFEKNADPEINKFVTKYLQAKLDLDSKKLKKMVTDKNGINMDEIQKRTEFVESYDNIQVYTTKGVGDVDYIVYYAMELKIASIDTKGEGLDAIYLKKVDGKYKSVTGEVSKETAEYAKKVRESAAVKELSEKVVKKLKKAVKSDEALAEFYKKLEEVTKKKTKS